MKKVLGIVILMGLLCLAGCIEPEPNGVPPISTIVGAENGWIGEGAIFTLNATDDGAGVNATYYRTWYNSIWTNWTVYTEPFNLSGEGTHHIEFFSNDLVGNVEAVQNTTYQLDSTPPTTIITVEEPVGIIYVGSVVFDGNQTVNCSKLILTPGSGTILHCKVLNIATGLIEMRFTDEYQLYEGM